MSLQESTEPQVHSSQESDADSDIDCEGVIDTREKYFVVQTAIEVLEPIERLVVMRNLGSQITSSGVRRLYQRDLQYLEAFIVSEQGRNTVVAAFMRVFNKNPPFVIFAGLCIAGLVFKFGYSLSSTWSAYKTFGIWGG
ncbi:hypothetical protein [Comamonas testosteroni]|uniref:hypothetical protein n=1 Tax=Comamonas testosteroni TaxID=285 RepID=UPI0005B52AC3|nr:hypothetical protein [Comamonas testosteroni]